MSAPKLLLVPQLDRGLLSLAPTVKPAHEIQVQRGKFIIQALQGARALLQHTGGHLTCPEKLQRAQQVMPRLAKEATQFADKEGLRQRRGAWKLHAYTVVNWRVVRHYLGGLLL